MKTAILLSGGVDSSVALALLRARGFTDVTAFYLKIWLEDELAYLGDCPWETDLEYARAVCDMMDVPLEIVPLQSEYFARVVEHTVAELRAGRTPSPDILCNQRIKFGEFFKKIDPAFEKVATGHYAQVVEENGVFRLKRAPDPVKDQTYFLSHLDQSQLSRALFPIGHLTKNEVRQKAIEFNLPTKDRKDSQGICFLGKIQYPEFVRFHLGEKDGAIVEIETGKELGRHSGYWFYTIGQRQGLGLGNGPWFVIGKNVEKNIVYVSHKENFSAKTRNQFLVTNINWIGEAPSREDLRVKIRHGREFFDCRAERNGVETDRRVTISQKDGGIAPGQYAIFYEDEFCLGGGFIAE